MCCASRLAASRTQREIGKERKLAHTERDENCQLEYFYLHNVRNEVSSPFFPQNRVGCGRKVGASV